MLRTEEEEQRLREAEACVNEVLNGDDESVEQATYELSKNEIEDNDDDDDNNEERDNSDHEQDNDNEDQGEIEQIEEELQMIDSDIEVEPY